MKQKLLEVNKKLEDKEGRYEEYLKGIPEETKTQAKNYFMYLKAVEKENANNKENQTSATV